MRILYLTELLTDGGTAKHVSEMLPHLREAGIEPVVWSRGKQGRYAEHIRKSGIEIIYQPKLISALMRHPIPRKFHLVHSYLYGPHLCDVLACRAKQIPYIKSTRNTGYWHTNRLSVLLRIKIRSFFVKHHLVNSEDVKNYLIKRENIKAHTITVIQNGIADFCHSEPFLDRKDYGIDEADFVLISVAWLKKKKSIDFIIKSMKKICNIVHKSKLLIVGDGPLENSLKKLAKDLGIYQQCVFVGRQEDTHAFFRMADVAVSASEQEGMSNSSIEAQMMGKPVIACSAAAGNQEIIYHGKTGFLFGSENTDEFVSHVVTLYQNGPLREQMVRAARDRFMTCFTVAEQARRYARFYRSIARFPHL